MTKYFRFLRKVRATVIAMCTEKVLCCNRGTCAEHARGAIQIEEIKTRPQSRANTDAPLSEEGSPLEKFSPHELHLASLKPIERFRLQYGNVAGILRERSLYDPHPRRDHAWIAARLVNVFGLYNPCVSFEQDYAAAVAEWEAMNLPAKAEEEERRAHEVQSEKQQARNLDKALRDPIKDIRNIPDYVRKQRKETAESLEGRSDSVMEIAGKLMYTSAEMSLALKHGTEAGRKIIKFRRGEKANKHSRGKQLHEEEVKRAEAKMLEDYKAGVAMGQGENGLEPGWTRIDVKKKSEDGDELLEPVTEVEGTYAVENGRPMVKVSSAQRLLKLFGRR